MQLLFRIVAKWWYQIAAVALLVYVYDQLRWRRIAIFTSDYNDSVEVLERLNGERAMAFCGIHQGFSTKRGDIKKSYWHLAASATVDFCSNRRQPSVLLMGLGAGTIPRLIYQQKSGIEQTVIEI